MQVCLLSCLGSSVDLLTYSIFMRRLFISLLLYQSVYSFFTVTIPYPLVETDCYSVTSSDQLYVANPGCYGNCSLVPYCFAPLNEITCVTPPYTCELEI